ADATSLAAAHGRLWKEEVHEPVVHAHRPGLETLGDRAAALAVFGKNAAVEPVAGVVREPHRLLGIVDFHDRNHRTEGFLAHDVHIMRNVDQHGGLVIVAAEARVPPAPR